MRVKPYSLPLDHEEAEMLLVAVLRQSVTYALTDKFAKKDQPYNERFIEAANLVLVHFGGESAKVNAPKPDEE